ncbi:hypothetical protein [Rufibacter radiotolerans]|uniref:hypothetical protein n=1 Tax=Rufibacter radiotolerans TaxID=1379910 RepID=UPI0006647F36|nr:hypothetical protein [Rufibacter radiotolerans]
MKKNLLEWSVFGVSLLLILALVGYLAIKSFSYQDNPPDLKVMIIPEPGRQDQNIYRLELMNHGEQAAENIQVEVALVLQGQELETAQAMFPLAPHKSTMKAWVTFRSPRAANQEVKVHVLGYNQP